MNPLITADDGVRLYYEDAGTGTAVVFVHEFAGDHRSWEPQLRHFSRRYRCIAYNARTFADFVRHSSEHSAQGSANTMLGYQARRPSLFALVEEMARIDVPALIVAGDEDEGSLEASLLMKRTIPTAALAVLPKSGHVLNMEEPAVFNRLLEDFFHQVEAGRWTPRDPAAKPPSIYGPAGKP